MGDALSVPFSVKLAQVKCGKWELVIFRFNLRKRLDSRYEKFLDLPMQA